MDLFKIEIISDFAHFKIPLNSKKQRTYKIPPISTVIGILENIYSNRHEVIQEEFILGYEFEYDKVYTDIQRIYKEVNLKEKTYASSYNSEGYQVSDACEIEYLYNPKLIIYTDINKDFICNQVLNLGKTDCLAKISKVDTVKLEISDTCKFVGKNQYTPLSIGNGVIKKISYLTKFNKYGFYDIETINVRENKEFYSKYAINEKGIFLWKLTNGGGTINEYIF
ncbi:CRISPR-associated protein Cas5 [Clostridium thermobutyricum]|uniref:CRISPR-associated protein Cas5 n=1 Tax=Clostridium thermobutyricum TaxID=29372 RepID=UPI0018A8D5BF|nr:CRISPR-associated protein Cas5 [Clostridium thermobutyricum]